MLPAQWALSQLAFGLLHDVHRHVQCAGCICNGWPMLPAPTCYSTTAVCAAACIQATMLTSRKALLREPI